MEQQLLRILTGRRLTSWKFSQRGRGVELGTTEKKSRWRQGGGFEPGTSGFQIQRPKPPDHASILTIQVRAPTKGMVIVFSSSVRWV